MGVPDPAGDFMVAVLAGEPFVGRDRELAQLVPVFAALAAGQGRIVVVSGEAGIGKTRACVEVAERARLAGARVVSVRCWLDGGAPPLWPWQTVLAELGGRAASKLLASGAAPADVGPDRFDRFVAVTERLAEACAGGPVCLVIDDVHGADPGALLLIRFLSRSLPGFPLLLVLGRRRGEPAPGGAEARLLDEIEQEALAIPLRGFDLAETSAFLASHGHREPDDHLVGALHGLTGGNPLFLRRVVPAPATRSAGAEPGLSGGLRLAIEQAVGGLGADAGRVLAAAAVLGPTPLVSEVAELTGRDTVTVLDAVDRAVAAGLVDRVEAGDGRFGFRHELVRSVLEDRLGVTERLDAHARAATVVAADHLADHPADDLAGPAADHLGDHPSDHLAGPTAHRLARAAHHARRAAPRSVDDARRAVEQCEAAGRAMVRNYAYEQADALFSAAFDLHTSARLGQPRSPLVLAWAQAAALRGHLGEARRRYGLAVARAEAEDRVGLLAEAALGWGGVWLGGYGTPHERARMLHLYRRVHDALPDGPDHDTRRTRLDVRLVAERAFDTGSTEGLDEVVTAARRTGDARALAEALTLAHHARFVPAHTRDRMVLADELVELASRAELGVLSLMGLLWRTIDILHLGAQPCTRALEQLRERATALGSEDVVYYVGVVDVLLLVGQGRFADAEAAADRGFELGERIGQPDSFVYRAVQRATMRWMQGREAELIDGLEPVATSPTLSDDEFSVWAMAAALTARAGDHRQARVVLERCLPADPAELAPSGTWMVGMVALVEAAAALGDEALARLTHDLLLPHADLPAVAGLGIACLGSTHRAVGVAARVAGDLDRAVEHLERAVVEDQRLGNRPMAAISRAELAAALAHRGDDRARVESLLRKAVAEGTAMGLTGRVATWEADLAHLGSLGSLESPESPAGSPAGAPGPAPCTTGVIRREGRRWVVGLGDRRISVPHRLGLTYLAELLTHPGQRIPALTLAALNDDVGAGAGRPQDLLDGRARDAYAARARELARDLAEAEEAHDLHRAERFRLELDALVDELASATGLNGRARHFVDDRERARVAVQKAIKRAVDVIGEADPALAELLHETVTTGAGCSYAPDPRIPVTWSRHPEDGRGPDGW